MITWKSTERCSEAEDYNLGIDTTANNSQNRWPTWIDNKELTALYFQNLLAHVSQSLDFLLIDSKCFICPCPETDTKYQIFQSKTFLNFSFNEFLWLSEDQGLLFLKCVAFKSVQIPWVIEPATLAPTILFGNREGLCL